MPADRRRGIKSVGLLSTGAVVVVLLIVLAAWLRGPDTTPTTVAEVVGGWQSTGGARLTLRADRTADVEGLPVRLTNAGLGADATPEVYRHPWSGPGKWDLEPERKGLRESVTLVVNRATFPLYTSRDGKSVRLFFYIGDSNQERRYWLDKS